MDTSEIYVKMCRGVEEIQKWHELQAGDFYKSGGTGEIVLLPMEHHIKDFCNYWCLYLVGGDDTIWLPRQDQLQAMVTDFSLGIWSLMAKFGRWCDEWGGQSRTLYSGEQLWLGFVMKEKFNKIWDGQEWTIKVGEPALGGGRNA